MDEDTEINLSLEDNIFIDMSNELASAEKLYPPFHTAHEAYAVILEELDEFKAEVWKKPPMRDKVKMKEELTQVGAMCARAILDLELAQ